MERQSYGRLDRFISDSEESLVCENQKYCMEIVESLVGNLYEGKVELQWEEGLPTGLPTKRLLPDRKLVEANIDILDWKCIAAKLPDGRYLDLESLMFHMHSGDCLVTERVPAGIRVKQMILGDLENTEMFLMRFAKM